MMLERTKKTKLIAFIGMLSAIYSVTALLPFPTIFVGGTGNMNMGLIGSVLVGILSYEIMIKYAKKMTQEITAVFTVGLISGLISAFISPFNFAGFFYILLALTGIVATYTAMRGKYLLLGPLIWISLVTIFMWITYALPLINIPHIIGIISGIILFLLSLKNVNKIISEEKMIYLKIPLAAIVGTISEWCMLNIYATIVLALPRDLWFIIMPLVFIERSTAVIFGTIFAIPIIKSVKHLLSE